MLLELFFLYVLYKFIFDFIIPVYQTTKQVKQKVNKMQQDMKEQINRQQQYHDEYKNSTGSKTATASSGKDDYIEFEEVK
jgi:capsular polysaccharide biosynthesis protein